MSRWVLKGIKTGIVTTRYPAEKENSVGISPGLPHNTPCLDDVSKTICSLCPNDALHEDDGFIRVEQSRCIHCFRCIRENKDQFHWDMGFEWTTSHDKTTILPKSFQRSLNIRVVDAGDCGACLNEIKLLNNPFYNMHRLGIFITPTPRKADVLLVVGPVTDHMKDPLLKAYEAMPAPKRVISVGTCALCGGIMGPGFTSGAGVAEILPVDMEIPGCPPPPLAILHGLLAITGRKQATPVADTGQPIEKVEEKIK